MENTAYETQALTDKDKQPNGAPDTVVIVEETKLDLIYSIHDTPPWYLCIFLGFQHFLTAFGGILSIPFVILPAMCSSDPLVLSEVINTNFFVSGLVTVIQSSFGIRLPIIQGGTFALLPPTFVILALPEWRCPEEEVYEMADNTTNLANTDDIWKLRMREIQGAIILASLFQVLVGVTGMVGILLRFMGPLVIAPTIALIGLALFRAAADYCAKNWWIALMTMTLIILFSQYLRNVGIPCCSYKKSRGWACRGYRAFMLFPIVLAILVSWGVCAILTVTNAIPNDSSHWAYATRTDINTDVIRQAKWFRFPYPGQWGLPTFSVAAMLGMLAGTIAGIVESIGDYHACARLAGAPPPPVHAINRGVFVEGIGGVLNGLWGTGTGTASYSGNIAAVGLTRVGSVRIIFFAGVIMVLLGMLGKFGALFVTIPDPVIGGMFMVLFGLISAVGISNLQFVDMNSSRNLLIFGFSLFFGLSLPQWLEANPNAIKTGNEVGDHIITVLLSTSMFVGGTVAFALDNTVPGSRKERGANAWQQNTRSSSDQSHKSTKSEQQCYDLPFGMSVIKRFKCVQYWPISPTFTSFRCSPCLVNENSNAKNVQEAKSE